MKPAMSLFDPCSCRSKRKGCCNGLLKVKVSTATTNVLCLWIRLDPAIVGSPQSGVCVETIEECTFVINKQPLKLVKTNRKHNTASTLCAGFNPMFTNLQNQHLQKFSLFLCFFTVTVTVGTGCAPVRFGGGPIDSGSDAGADLETEAVR
jgi:hypothetical protein